MKLNHPAINHAIGHYAIGVVGIAIAVMAAGCGASSRGTAADTGATQVDQAGVAAKNPCQLATVAELTTIVATVDKLSPPPKITQTKETDEFQGRTCQWQYPHKELVSDTAEISVTAWHGQQYYTPDVIGGFTKAPGIGDAADAGPSMLMFRKGAEVFAVSVLGDANGAALRPEIAKLIVGKLT
jgi:hypothetical protein